MTHVVVVTTGGTIASAADESGRAVARVGGSQVVDAAGMAAAGVETRDLLNIGSYRIGHRELRLIADAVQAELVRDDVAGVVVTHGTDTMEETAFLLDLLHDGAKPVVLTGAQKAADRPDTDGPQNLREAVAVAGSAEARGCGVLIVFAGYIFAARRTRKTHTLAAEPFHALDSGPSGWVSDGLDVHVVARPVRLPTLPRPEPGFDDTRVDVVVAHPNADAALAHAAIENGAAGVVLAGTGAGNGNRALRDWIPYALERGVLVGLSTRVAEGPVVPVYGDGGGADLIAAGALNMGSLPLFHARLLLALLLSTGTEVSQQTMAPYV